MSHLIKIFAVNKFSYFRLWYLLTNMAANLVLAGLTPTEKEDKYKTGRLPLNVFSL